MELLGAVVVHVALTLLTGRARIISLGITIETNPTRVGGFSTHPTISQLSS